MGNLYDEVPIPPKDQMNVNLSPATEKTMLQVFDRPGELTEECSDPSGEFTKRVSGLDFALETLIQLFLEVKREEPLVFDQVKTGGVLCVRVRRSNPTLFSNHSWGTAIDLYFGNDVVPQGKPVTHRGNLVLAPYFNKYGWYWGSKISGESVDSMHFELAEEIVLKLQRIIPRSKRARKYKPTGQTGHR